MQFEMQCQVKFLASSATSECEQKTLLNKDFIDASEHYRNNLQK